MSQLEVEPQMFTRTDSTNNTGNTEIKFSDELTIQHVFEQNYDTSKYFLNSKIVNHEHTEYKLVQYNKTKFNNEYVDELKNIRSLIFDNNTGRLLCFAPPKNVDYTTFKKDVAHTTDIYIEPHIEGTMINVFYHPDSQKWIYSTKGSIGAKNSFFRVDVKGMTFSDMFEECLATSSFDLEKLNKDCCYSFVIQHVNNRLVSCFKENDIILTRVYKITFEDGVNRVFDVTRHPDILTNKSGSKKTYSDEDSYIKKLIMNQDDDIRADVNNQLLLEFNPLTDSSNALMNRIAYNVEFPYVGINIMCKKTGNRLRYRDPRFQYIRNLRGNQPKLEYHYMDLRKLNKITEFLSYYPEYHNCFQEYQSKVQSFTRELYQNYVSCYIQKMCPLKDFPKQFRTHMFNIHNIYKKIKLTGKSIRLDNVVEYINTTPSDIMLYSLNFSKRTVVETV